MLNTIPEYRTSDKTILPAHYAQAASWLTFHEWKRLTERARHRSTMALVAPGPKFETELERSNLKAPVKFTLTVMRDHADGTGRVSISKAALANMLGTDTRTIQRHWAAAIAAGFLTKYDYPQDVKRPSDMWIWPGNAPKRDTRWDKYPDTPMQDTTTPPPW